MTRISYGKLSVPVHCVGVPAPHGLLALDVSVEVLGEGFLAAYTAGDNRRVVATDTMKNVILRHALEHEDATAEAFLASLGRRFLAAYGDMEALRLSAVELPFAPVGEHLFSLNGGERAVAEVELSRDGIAAARSGLVGLRLLKTTGSAFTRFARDDATTLPERADRPLFVHLDVHWRPGDPADDSTRPADVRDVLCTVFAELVSESIQHLVHAMGTRLLERFPALAEVSFRAENHTHDPVPGSEQDAPRRAYTAAFPAYGLITLTLAR